MKEFQIKFTTNLMSEGEFSFSLIKANDENEAGKLFMERTEETYGNFRSSNGDSCNFTVLEVAEIY